MTAMKETSVALSGMINQQRSDISDDTSAKIDGIVTLKLASNRRIAACVKYASRHQPSSVKNRRDDAIKVNKRANDFIRRQSAWRRDDSISK